MPSGGSALSAGLSIVGGAMQGKAAKDAAKTSANAQTQAAQIAADAAKFRPVGVTTNFGASKFGMDSEGYVNSAGYALSPQLQSSQNMMMNAANGLQMPSLFDYVPTDAEARTKYSDLTDKMAALVAGGQKPFGSRKAGRRAFAAAKTNLQNEINAAHKKAMTPKLQGGQAAYDKSLSEYNAFQNDQNRERTYLEQFLDAKKATQPMGEAAQTMFSLGNSYLSTSPQEQAAKYYAEQQALLTPTNQRNMADLQARLSAQGRLGVATGATTDGMRAANPELEAYYNAMNMQDRNLAASSTQGGMDYAKFGAGMVGGGGDMLSSMYNVQSNAYNPYKTAMGGASMVEGLGQNALDLGMNIGKSTNAANAQSGMLMGQGMANAAQTMQPANAYSPWGSILSGAGNAIGQYTANTPQANTGGYSTSVFNPGMTANTSAISTPSLDRWF